MQVISREETLRRAKTGGRGSGISVRVRTEHFDKEARLFPRVWFDFVTPSPQFLGLKKLKQMFKFSYFKNFK